MQPFPCYAANRPLSQASDRVCCKRLKRLINPENDRNIYEDATVSLSLHHFFNRKL